MRNVNITLEGHFELTQQTKMVQVIQKALADNFVDEIALGEPIMIKRLKAKEMRADGYKGVLIILK